MHKRKRNIQLIIYDLRSHIKESKLSQSTYGFNAGVGQPTISRLFSSGKSRIKYSINLEKLCNYAKIDYYEPARVKDIAKNKELIDALELVWDGSKEHSKKLARFIKELGCLTNNA